MKLKDFKTKKAINDYARELLYKKIGECDDVKGKSKDGYDKVIELIERHPDFKTKTNGMIKIAIRQGKFNKNALELIIIKENNTEEDISWHTCISGKHKSYKTELLDALRNSISTQTRTFKYQSELICAFCESSKNLQVDHYDPDFQDLVIDFHETSNIKIPEEFGDDPYTHCRKFKDIDNNYEEQWQKYHKDNANLRILCAKCNYSRPKTRNKFKLT